MNLSFKFTGWLAAGVITLGTSLFLIYSLSHGDKRVFLPGQTSNGHYQIEEKCDLCHTNFQSVKQDACLNCHAEELQRVSDSHPRRLFSDPRNASQLIKVDARYCISCHAEHVPEITNGLGATVQSDFCVSCHKNIAEDRPTHKSFAATSCASAGCHNYHDNTALYEEFLVKHAGEPATSATPRAPMRNLGEFYRTHASRPIHRLTAAQADNPASDAGSPAVLADWAASAHAASDVDCKACHEPETAGVWNDKVDRAVCESCHKEQVRGFLGGKHGMRLAQKLSPMKPGMARLPMDPKAVDKPLDCQTCHVAHRYDTVAAAVDSCLGCHTDKHSKAYKDSPHYKLWQREVAGLDPKSTGVSCATCHFPRQVQKSDGFDLVLVEHNQNNILRPNSKMLRSACMSCHGLAFSMDSLADRDLIERNFNGKPKAHIKSQDMAISRVTK